MFRQPTLDPDRLRSAMQAANLDPVELGKAVNIRPGLIRRYRTGSARCTGVQNITRLSRALGVGPLDHLTKRSEG